MGIRAGNQAIARAAAAVAWLVFASCSADPKGTDAREQDPTMMAVQPGPTGGGGSPAGGGAAPGGPLPGGSNAPPATGAMDSGMPGPTMPPAMTPADAAVADAGPLLPTVCADEDAGLVDEDAGPLDCIVVGDLALQYRASDTNTADNQVKPHFNIVNKGKKSVNLAELTVRYWFEDDGAPQLVFWCDYAQIGCGSVRGAFAKPARENANRTLEVTFTTGTLAAGAATGEIQTRFNKEDWSLFDERDDYSFDAKKTAFADWYKVTLYQRGQLIWGLEPK